MIEPYNVELIEHYLENRAARQPFRPFITVVWAGSSWIGAR